jgi:hypothetical protein
VLVELQRLAKQCRILCGPVLIVAPRLFGKRVEHPPKIGETVPN